MECSGANAKEMSNEEPDQQLVRTVIYKLKLSLGI